MRNLFFIPLLAGSLWAQAPGVLPPATGARIDSLLQAVAATPFATAPLPRAEAVLQPLGPLLLGYAPDEVKLKVASVFLKSLKSLLARPESWDYGFDSLKNVSRLSPADGSFRIFTWMMVEQDRAFTYRQSTHYGLVQRRDSLPNRPCQVTELVDNVDLAEGVENAQLRENLWMGAIYYKPEQSSYGVLTFRGQLARINPATGKLRTEPVTYYVLLGYNGHDIGSDYKIVEVITFDPRQPNHVLFGAPIFEFGNMGKYRVVFKYADNGAFSLNQRTVVSGLFRRKRSMLVFDHLVAPTDAPPVVQYNMGPDGTQDALYWLDRVKGQRKGFFLFVRNVTVVAPGIEGYSPKEVRRQANDEAKRLRRMGVPVAK